MKYTLDHIGRILATAEVPQWERLVAEAREAGESLWDSGDAKWDGSHPSTGDIQVTITRQRDDFYDFELSLYVPLGEMVRESA